MKDKPKLTYFQDQDILHLLVAEGPEANSVEISPGVTVELDDSGTVIGIEVLNASAFLRDTLLDTVQAKFLNLNGHQHNA